MSNELYDQEDSKWYERVFRWNAIDYTLIVIMCVLSALAAMTVQEWNRDVDVKQCYGQVHSLPTPGCVVVNGRTFTEVQTSSVGPLHRSELPR